jgi:xylulokinase
MSKVHLGIDVGTSATKVLALAEDGTTRAKARRAYPTHAPATNWAEQSVDDWWQATAGALAEVTGAIGGAEIAAIGLSGQLNGLVLVDDAGVPLQDAIIWLDLRAGAEAEELAEQHGAQIAAVSGNGIGPISVMAKLLWMRRHRSEMLAKARRMFMVKDYILWHLTGTWATDPSDASAINLMDLKKRQWSAELCRAVGIAPALLPPIRPSTAVAGAVHQAASAATGVPVGTPVICGGGDVAALATGCGVIDEGVLGVTLGTAGHVVLSSKEPLAAPGEGVWQIVHMAEGRVVWLGLIMAGGLSLSWLQRTFGLGSPAISFEALAELAKTADPGARGLTFLPFLEGAATPYNRPDARAAFIGLTSSHGPAEITRAVLEGVAFNLKDCVELFEQRGAVIDQVRLAEGGSRVAAWCQVIADVLRRPVNLVEEADTSALGAAIAARAGESGASIAEIARTCVRTGGQFMPGTESPAYGEPYARYRRLAEQTVSAQ